MSKYIVIIFSLMVLLMALVSGGWLLLERLSRIDLGLYLASLEQQVPVKETEPLTAEGVRAVLAEYRWKQGLTDYLSDSEFCGDVLDYDVGSDMDLATVPCEDCHMSGLLQLPKRVPAAQVLSVLQSDDQARSVLDSERITNVCVWEGSTYLSVFFAERVDGYPEATKTVEEQASTMSERSRDVIKNFTEAELWEALQTYRDSHNVRQLELSEDVCRYARKRVQDHLDDFENRPKEDYPRQDKYPLDAHEGFSHDADSGYVFDVTGKRKVAENLAYWPDADYPNRVIEWGWDSSTEGHREAQLSQEYAFGCLTGKDGFYVAIFAE